MFIGAISDVQMIRLTRRPMRSMLSLLRCICIIHNMVEIAIFNASLIFSLFAWKLKLQIATNYKLKKLQNLFFNNFYLFRGM